jgi:Bacterial Ig-like domain (group 1)
MTCLRLVLPLCLVALVAAAPAQAVRQSPKNGCQSQTIPADYGYLTSPQYTTFESVPQLQFWAWWEIESINPARDDFGVEVSTDGGATWAELDTSFGSEPSQPEGAQPDLPYSNSGFNQTPAFQQFTAQLPSGLSAETQNQRIRFKFKPLDHEYNGFRGLGIDSVVAASNALNEGFEGGAPGWTFTGYWHVKGDPQQQAVLSPSINPALVTLPGSGNLPSAQAGKNIAWYGEDQTGTFCGKDFAFEPPPSLSVSPTFEERPIGDTHTVRLTLLNPDGTPAPGQTLRWSVSGANPQPSAELITGDDGTADVSWTGPEAGSDTLQVHHDPNGNDAQDSDEAAATATVDWQAPVAGSSVNVAVLSGVVRVKLPAGASLRPVLGLAQSPGFVQLTRPVQIPVGSVVDAKRGTVGLTSASDLQGGTQNGSFKAGRFRILQRRTARPITQLKMTGGSFSACRRNVNRSSARIAARRIRRLSGNARGRFRTRGRNSSATVRGTSWTMADQCNGTLTRVRSGSVRVRDFAKNRTVTLRRGRSYLARPKGR